MAESFCGRILSDRRKDFYTRRSFHLRFGSGRNSQRVLFYSDTVDYGGHEALTVEVARYLATQQQPVNVVFAFYD